jgi:hypothetical protein
LVGDFSNLNRIDEGRVFPRTPEFAEAQLKHDEAVADLKARHEDGTLTIELGTEIQSLLVSLSEKMDTNFRGQIKCPNLRV